MNSGENIINVYIFSIIIFAPIKISEKRNAHEKIKICEESIKDEHAYMYHLRIFRYSKTYREKQT